MFYTYVLQSKKDGALYIGWTKDLKNRMRLHNDMKVPSTKQRTPLILLYYEACLEEKDAIAREKALKTGFGRSYLKKRLSL